MEPTSSPVDKSKIDLTVYEIKKSVHLYTYTAKWCGPCMRIKPKVVEIMSKHNYKVLSQEIIEKTEFKEKVNEFVPFFVVMSFGQIYCPDGLQTCDVLHSKFRKVASIQTSDEQKLRNFFSDYNIGEMVLDDDF